MTRLDAFTIAGNYPENLKICSALNPSSDKWAGFIYLLKDGQIHRLLLTTKDAFDSEEISNTEIEDFVKELSEQVNQGKV